MNLRWLSQFSRKFARKSPPLATDALGTLQANLTAESSLTQNFIVLIISSCLIATFGLISNSAAVIIGAMIIAPLMLPIRALAFGALEGDISLFRESLKSLIVGTLSAIALSALIGRLISIPEFGSEVLARTQPNLVDLGVAVTAGAVSGYAKVRPQISDALAGTAIAVALMPPLCVVGLTLSQGFWPESLGSFLLFLTNLLGIALACMLVFILKGYTKVSHALSITLGLTSILLIPLGISFFNLVRQAQLQALLRKTLVNRTVTIGQQVQLVGTKVNWRTSPPEAHLTVLAHKPITSKQVRLVEQFVAHEMKQPFKIIVRVSQIQEVQADEQSTQQ